MRYCVQDQTFSTGHLAKKKSVDFNFDLKKASILLNLGLYHQLYSSGQNWLQSLIATQSLTADPANSFLSTLQSRQGMPKIAFQFPQLARNARMDLNKRFGPKPKTKT